MNKKKDFRVDWVLNNELAIGRCPINKSDLDKLNTLGIKSILSLCSEEEIKFKNIKIEGFIHKRFVLPDHKVGKDPTFSEIKIVLDILKDLFSFGPVFIHCVAAMERSPLICMAWLIKNKRLDVFEALNYMMEIHPGTNPLPSQIRILQDENFTKNF